MISLKVEYKKIVGTVFISSVVSFRDESLHLKSRQLSFVAPWLKTMFEKIIGVMV